MKCLTFEIFTHKTPNPRWGGVGLICCYYFSRQFMTFPGLLIVWPPKIPTATPFGGGGGKKLLSIFSTDHEIYRTFEIWTPPPGTPPPQGGMGKNKLYWFSGQFVTFPGLLIFWPPKIPTATSFGGGGGVTFFYRFSRQFMKFTGLLKFGPPTPPPPRNPPPGVGWVKTNVLIFWTVHDISQTFDFLTP